MSAESPRPGPIFSEPSGIPEGYRVKKETDTTVFVEPISPEETNLRMRRALLGGIATTLTIGVADWTLLDGALTKRVMRNILNNSQPTTAVPKEALVEAIASSVITQPTVSLEPITDHRPEIEITYIEQAKTDPRINIQIKAKPPQEVEPRYSYSDEILPIPNGIKRAGFGKPIPYTCHWPNGPRNLHNALDIQGPKNGPIYTPADGKIVHVGYIYRENAQGNQVVIVHHPQHNLYCSYGHNSQAVVEVGQEVKQGDQIARIGDRGYCTPGYYHIHWEIWRANNFTGNPQNPWGEDAKLINPEDILQVLEKNS